MTGSAGREAARLWRVLDLAQASETRSAKQSMAHYRSVVVMAASRAPG